MKQFMYRLKEKSYMPTAIFGVYLLILLQGFLAVSLIPSIFRVDLITNIQPSYLVWWGVLRVVIVLPLIYGIFLKDQHSLKRIFYSLGNFNKMIQVAFWSTLLFVILGFVFYPYFLNQSALTADKFISYFPYFILFSISNAFVEETFFRGLLLSRFTARWGKDIGNNLQALAFALIHLPVIYFNPNATYFVLITFVLGYIWGYLTLKTKSILPAIIFHTVADIFFVISLF